ncbi:MAG: DNA polymerase III subunit beta [Saprospiraceae bacterium]|nr:DNA polymerase III subunit beta [Saprospiraceae bacterium]MDW8484758.1 DNA polymerase III subunit beta [Saprospiraceae bacterium]
MKFSVSSSELLKHVQVAAGALGSNPVLPILENFLFGVSGKHLSICATDLETTISTQLEVQADEDFSVAVPAKLLLDTLKALPPQPITLSVNEENFSIEITSSYGRYKVAGERGTHFPEVPQPENVDSVKINSKYLVEAIAKTAFATSNDELRPAMTGVYFQVDFHKLTCVATDAHRLVKFTTPHLVGEVATSFIVPKKALTLLKNTLPADATVEIAFNCANAFFTFDSIHLVCRLIDARYPDYNAVIPVDNPNRLIVQRADFQNSLKRIAIFANKTTNQVVLDIAHGNLTLSAQDLDFSNEATEQMPCTYEGIPLRIAFNAKFLVEMLGVLDTDEIKLELSTPSRAGVLTPVEEENTDREILMLVMPVMLNA